MSAGNFSSYLNTVTLPEFSDLIIKQFSTVQEMVKPVAQQLFIYDDLTSWPHEQKRYDEVDIETFAKQMRQGENAQKARSGVGYNKTMTARRFAMEINVSWQYRRYGKDQQVKADLYSMNHFIEQRIELNLSHRFTFCTSSSYNDLDGETVDVTVGDGLPLAYSAHTVAFSSSTYSNRVSGDPAFTQGSLELAEALTVSNIISNFGERRVLKFNNIVTSDDPNTCRMVKQVLNSTADVEAVQSGVLNAFKGKYNHVELPYLATTATGARDDSKKRWWFLVAASNTGMMGWQAYFGIFESANMKTPVAGGNGEDPHNDDWAYGTRGSHGICILSGRGLEASCPTN